MILSTIIDYLKDRPIRTVLGLGLAGLITLTSLSNNINFAFGSLTITNPQENQYTWGIIPVVNIEGDSGKANFYTFGAIPINFMKKNSKLEGNLYSFGLFSLNLLKNNSKIGDLNTYGIIMGVNNNNKTTDSSSFNNASAYGIVAMNPNKGDVAVGTNIDK